MKTTSNLQLITLAHLSRSQGRRKTLYEIMIEVNQIFTLVDAPYSPGAFYPAMKSLAKEKMININHNGCCIERAGLAHTEALLLSQPLPGSPMGILYRLLAANILGDAKIRSAAKKRIDIELIKFDQSTEDVSQKNRQSNQALNIVRQQLSLCLRKILLELRDDK